MSPSSPSPSTTRLRILLASSSVALALLVAAALRWSSSGPAAVSFAARGAELDAVFAGRDDAPSRVRLGEDFYVEPVDEATARKLFVMQTADFVFHPDCYYRYRPGIEERIEWAEHPSGAWVRRTNARGMREDTDAELEGLSVLVVGDSHADGVCNNSESFANLLEDELAPLGPATSWNAGVVGYSFYNYLGVLVEHLELAPDVFVVAVYGGNDFVEVLRPHHYFRGTVLPPRRQGYRNKIMEARAVSSTALAQGLNQVLYFQEYPDQIEVALEAALSTSAEIGRLCEERGIRPVFAYIPPAFEAPWPGLEDMTARAREVLELTSADMRVARRLADEYLSGLTELGIEHIDLAPVFRASAEPCYWARDLHINLTGHALVAHALAGTIRAPRPAAEPTPREASADEPARVTEDGEALLVEGEWLDGERHGIWVRRYLDGTVHSRGEWHRGDRVGEWSWWYEDGALKKRGVYVDGEPDGRWVEWHRNGTRRREGVWERGRPHGYWEQWYADGSRASEGAYRNGVRDGVWATRLEGDRPDTRATYRNGVLEGQFKKWERGGEIVSLGQYGAGERTGLWRTWWPDGTLRARGEFEADRRVGPWVFWDAEGEVDPEKTGWYRAGKRVCGMARPAELVSLD